MLMDGNEWTPSGVIDTEVCIIGTGIGGGTLVNRLAAKGCRFVVLEAGSAKKSDSVTFENVGRHFVMPATRSIELGGTSNLWHGVLSPLDRADFETRSWVPGSGWPITYDELLPHYREAAELLGVERYAYYDQAGLPEEFARQVPLMPFDGKVIENKFFQQPLAVTRFKRIVTRAVIDSQDRHCLLNVVALELLPGEGKRVVDRVLARTASGRSIEVRAKAFVVAAGALETPRLLLNSRKFGDAGVGNQNDLVGRYLMDHPMGNLLQVQFKKRLRAPIYSDTKSSPAVKLKTGLLFTREIQEREGLPNHCFFIRPSFVEGIDDESERIKLALLTLRHRRMTFSDFVKVVTNMNVIAQVLAYKTWLKVTYRYGDLFFLTEQMPSADSRVTLSDKKDRFGYPIARVDWRVSRADLETMQRSFRVITTQAFSREHFDFTHKAWTDTGWEERFSSAAHHVGTVRMGATARTGVVDSSLRVFGAENLYVCDGSVFTTAGNVNNSLTISALACRLADRLAHVVVAPAAQAS